MSATDDTVFWSEFWEAHERLRTALGIQTSEHTILALGTLAASEIERLRAELSGRADLRKALDVLHKGGNRPGHPPTPNEAALEILVLHATHERDMAVLAGRQLWAYLQERS